MKKKIVVMLLLLALLSIFALSVSAAKALVMGWYTAVWKTNVFQPLNIDCVTSGSWVNISDWVNYDVVVITESQPKLTEEQVAQIESWVAAGGNLILANNVPSYLSPTGSLNLTGLQNLIGVKSYGYSPNAVVEQRILDSRHQLTNHFEEGEAMGRAHNSYWYGGFTTARILVGEPNADPTKIRATVFENELGLSKVYVVIGNPDPNAQKHLLLCKKLALLTCGYPVPENPSNVTANRDDSGIITLTWTPPVVPEGGTPITKYWIYRDTDATVTLDSERVATIEVGEGFQPSWIDNSFQDYQERGTNYYYAVVAVDSYHLQSDFSAPAEAPALLGTVEGRVVKKDDIESGIPNATLRLVDQETQSIKEETTDALGYYQFDNVIAAEYKLTVRVPLYLVDETDVFEVVVDGISEKNFQLVEDTRKSEPPSNLAANGPENNPGVIELSWKAPQTEPYAYYFRIYRSLVPEELDNYKALVPFEIPAPEQPCPPGAIVEWKDTTVVAGKTYYYLVTALTGSLVESDPSQPQSAAAEKVNVPQLVFPIDGEPIESSDITFEWNPVDNAKQYIVQYANNPEFNDAISLTPVTAPQTTVTKTGIAEGKWFWRVAVILNSNAQSEFSTADFSTVYVNSEQIGAQFFSVRPEYVVIEDHAILTFLLNNPAKVTLAIYDLKGKLIKRILDRQECNVGSRSEEWNLLDSAGLKVANGLYMVCLTMEDAAKNITQVRKGIVIYK